eukprot:NODE_2388_length_1130_cov_250.844588_g1985_i0.p1 GENE.NODE_2388_length_1130_cov_250.844588_g1985_i0~~NODE_2388_length_1130_cov_250.844588_g1985_i0.p1  ORF type:complete len:234 (+),score=97.15 NODE_2388_length_1130_cov_250.844588_g1985_i0:312-1013(+)
MPKNKGAGGKNRRRGTNKNEPVKRELIKKEEDQEYAQVTKMLGNGRVLLSCLDGQQRLGTIRGGMRKKIWVNAGDIVLLGLRDYQDKKADVIGKYQPEEVRRLIEVKEMPGSFGMAQTRETTGQEEQIIHFADTAELSDESGSEQDETVDPDKAKNITFQHLGAESSSEEEGEEEEEEEEEEVPQYTRNKPKVKDKRQLRAERKAVPSKGKGAAPDKKDDGDSDDEDVDIDTL